MEYTVRKTGWKVIADPQYLSSEEIHSGALLTSVDELDRIEDYALDAEVGTFIRNTNFDRASLLVLRTVFPTASGEYVLENVEQVDTETIHALTRAESRPGPSAQMSICNVIRITGMPTVSRAVVTLQNPFFEQGEELQFTIDAENK